MFCQNVLYSEIKLSTSLPFDKNIRIIKKHKLSSSYEFIFLINHEPLIVLFNTDLIFLGCEYHYQLSCIIPSW